MSRILFWWAPRIVHHWIWLLFHRTVVCLVFNDGFPNEYYWSSGELVNNKFIFH